MAGDQTVSWAMTDDTTAQLMSIQRALHRLPFFRQLSVEQVREVSRLGRTMGMTAGHIVCHEGELSDSMYVLLAGKVLVYRHGKTGGRVDMRQYEDGDYFGEIALLDSKPRTASVVCLTDCKLFVLEQADFRGLLTAHPSLVLSVLGGIADRAREHAEEHYQVELANLSLEAQAEVARHRSLAQMVAGVAHELNTPLGITNTAVDMIAKRLSRPEVVTLFESGSEAIRLLNEIQEATSLAQRNIARAHKLIQDFKRISVNQLVDTPQKDDLAQLIESTVDLFKISARQARLTIAVDNRLPAVRKEWFGYPGLLTQVLLNLLANIESYAYEPGIGGRVDIILSAAMTSPYLPLSSWFATTDTASRQRIWKGSSNHFLQLGGQGRGRPRVIDRPQHCDSRLEG